jgi:hypothetical protein
MGSRYKDFDAFFSERRRMEKREPVTFTLGGRTYTLPLEMPAIMPLTLLRLRKKLSDEDSIPEDEMLAMATALFGEDQLSDILSSRVGDGGGPLTIEELSDITQWAIDCYGEGASQDDEDSEGNSTPPA